MKERPKTQLVSLQIAPSLLELVDKLAERRFTTRSEFIRQALLAEIEKQGLCPVAA
jgi:metal-responsive CopG/Arc/MetJ family transcriptional regulator